MNKTIQPNDFASAISQILDEYGDEVRVAMGDAVRKAANEARKEVRANSLPQWKRYKSGWAVKFETSRLGIDAHVYNKTKYMLAHLLEFGHLDGEGKRKVYEGHEHIASANENTGDNVIKELRSLL